MPPKRRMAPVKKGSNPDNILIYFIHHGKDNIKLSHIVWLYGGRIHVSVVSWCRQGTTVRLMGIRRGVGPWGIGGRLHKGFSSLKDGMGVDVKKGTLVG